MSTAAAATETSEFNPDQSALLDHLVQHLRLKNDAQLAAALHVAPPVISKVRHHKLPVGASLLISMHEESGIEIKELRRIMGDRRKHFRGAASSDLAAE